MVKLERERRSEGIREFGLGITSLEDVFCNIVRLFACLLVGCWLLVVCVFLLSLINHIRCH